ncbi:hypothetical protein B9T62_05895 [Paenibacillus donghaensis]|uniref:DUF1848 domain-containing protein n=1 Tax=Paenibacillus donghaensis TaxID=414771 RepID=A0A2Z2KJM6_9BACL|nr:hypothetical protein B9T62_05895 [Paenibacillus donghaensis]
MIISASRRTDIPAFFGEWFMTRIREGYFYRMNPFNRNQVTEVSLKPEDVDAIVFWTKNPKPFVKYLDELDRRGYRYYFQYTLNDYPSVFEPNVPKLSSRIDSFKQLSERLGPQRVIWRYDPIMVSSITPIEYHLDKIQAISNELKGYSSRLIISFLDFYGKVRNRLKALESEHQLSFTDIADPEYAAELDQLLVGIRNISIHNQLEVLSCAEKLNLEQYNIGHGACIDSRLLFELFNLETIQGKDKNQRAECLCAGSADMGVYNTCRYNCTYCYAVQSEKAVSNALEHHFIDSPSLIDRYNHHN